LEGVLIVGVGCCRGGEEGAGGIFQPQKLGGGRVWKGREWLDDLAKLVNIRGDVYSEFYQLFLSPIGLGMVEIWGEISPED